MIRAITVAVVLLSAAAMCAAQPAGEPAKPGPADAEPAKPASQPAGGLMPRVVLETTLGKIVLELDGEKAPISTHNFLAYVDSGFYNNTTFHRVKADFMIQGGGFTADMDEKKDGARPPIKNEWENGLKNVRGTIAMARTAAPDSGTSQFFINVVDNPALDQPRGGAAYAVFGKVVEGLDVVDAIRNAKVTKHPKYSTPEGAVTPDPLVIVNAAKVVQDCDRAKLADAAKAADKRIEENRAKAVAEKAKADAERAEKEAAMVVEYIKKLEAETGKKVEKTASGLMFLILQEGTGATPKTTDTVKVHYVGTFLDGKEFDSSVSRGQPAEFPLNRVIPGWTEAVSLMKVGEKRTIICPPDLAYGARGAPPRIPPNSTLVFEIELLEVK